MHSIVWESFFTIGIVNLDKHHHDAVDLLNNIYEKFVNNESISELMATLNLLRENIKINIKSEEKLMKNSNYPLTEIHIFSHDQFFKLFDKIYLNLENGKYQFSFRLYATISYYMLSHILHEDSEMSEYIFKYNDNKFSMLNC